MLYLKWSLSSIQRLKSVQIDQCIQTKKCGPIDRILSLMEVWCEQHKIEHVFTQPGNPQQNAYVERFNRTVRYECLNQHLFRKLEDVQDCTTTWQHFYNHERPHMSVDGRPPKFKQ